ncbi:hypothetical protein HH310_19565 [Actinoplanes sp. TBRC 11911]|uniref:hypothetical protein n=1 Tax=Actinoplanes sp. TBRC 11911 TaxID=2729386 RepID=UPI00145C9CFA|nr:hypothetical protein [Actinoplanes sp. TBRC 11911]NMO53378.1 hypothetical protein [Actinoplanes sp. TBRC 11911]
MNIETELRAGLIETAGELDLRLDPWTSFQRRETRHRRNRLIRAGVAAAAVTALAGMQAGVVPVPGWAPTIALAVGNEALLNGPVRGSLAGDTAFLAGMRAQIRDIDNPDQNWRIGDRSKIRFLYAADVGDKRVVLAYVPLRFGFVTKPQLLWYDGAAGSDPAEMVAVANVDPAQRATQYVMASFDDPGVAVLVGPPGSTATISPGYEFGADGRVHDDPAVSGVPGSGIAETVLPPAPGDPGVTMTLTQDGRSTVVAQGEGGSGGSLPDEKVFDAALSKALGDRVLDHNLLRPWVQMGLDTGQMRLADARLVVRWTGEVNGQQAVLFTLQKAGGGVLAFAWHGSSAGSREDLRLLLPAAGSDRRPIAWRMYAEGSQVPTDQVIVIAPAGAARVTLTSVSGDPEKVAIDHSGKGKATVAPGAAATVTAYAADGSEMGSTPVPPFDDGTGIIGQTPGTRVVP